MHDLFIDQSNIYEVPASLYRIEILVKKAVLMSCRIRAYNEKETTERSPYVIDAQLMSPLINAMRLQDRHHHGRGSQT